MSTFIGQLIGFAVIIWLLVKFVLPPLRTAMAKQQDAIRTALEESRSAADRLASADQEHAKAVEDAHAEAARLTDEARTDSTRIAALAREQAASDAERIKVQGSQQLNLLHAQKIRELRGDLGVEAVRRAEALVRDHVADAGARSETVDRFLAELEQMAASGATSVGAVKVAEAGASLQLRAASREGLAAVDAEFDELAAGLDATALGTLGDELTAVAKFMQSEVVVTKLLVKASDDTQVEAPQARLARSLFNGKVGASAYTIVETAVAQRWSVDRDLIAAIQHVARLALLTRADKSQTAEEVEDQLFRFGRILDGRPLLTKLLGDYTTPAAQRLTLLNDVLDKAGSVNGVTRALLVQTVELLHGDRADEAVLDLAELAVTRRGELVANVTAAAELTAAQRSRLSDVLARIYGHPVSVQLETDPELLGGLQINVGDEVIDGSLSSRLAAARTGLPD